MRHDGDCGDRAAAIQAEATERAVQAHTNRTRADATPLVIDGHRHCVDCEEPINRRRLSAIPGAVRCAPCQDEQDRRRG